MNWLRKWLLKPIDTEGETLSKEYMLEEIDHLENEIRIRDVSIKELEKEVCHWKTIALNYKRPHF